MDDVDRRLLALLRDDARLSAATLARTLGVSRATVQNRIARLYASGRGVQKNLVEAAAWNLAAAGQGLSDAWLDQAVTGLSKDEKVRAERLRNDRAEQQ